MKRKIVLNEEVVKAINTLYELSERYAGCKAVLPIWQIVEKNVVDDSDSFELKEEDIG